MGSASWIQEGTPVPPPWHPHSTVFNQLTLYPLANLVPFTGNTSTSPLLWRASSYPQFTFQFPTGHTQSHTSSNTKALSQKPKHKSSNTRAPKTREGQSSFMAGIYRQWSCLQLCQVCQSASSSVLTLFWDFSLSQNISQGYVSFIDML